MKKHRITPLETMELEFLDKTLFFRFDMEAILKLQNEFGELQKVTDTYKGNECELIAIMLYSGIKDNEFTLDEARVIISSSAVVLVDTMSIVIKSLEVLGGEEISKKIQEEFAKLQIR